MQEGRAGAEVADDEEWLVDYLLLIAGKKQIVEQKAEPGENCPGGPDRIKEQYEEQALACQAAMRLFCAKKRAHCHAPKQFQVIGHGRCEAFSIKNTEKDRWVFLRVDCITQSGGIAVRLLLRGGAEVTGSFVRSVG